MSGRPVVAKPDLLGETEPWAALAETHSAVVVFAGDRAYKFKKPVRFDFLDFSTREARERAVHREVELNRRFAPDVYRGVADVIGEDGYVLDHLVVMRRMPAGRRLSALVAAGADVEPAVRDVARIMAASHAREPTHPAIAAVGPVRWIPEWSRGSSARLLSALRRWTSCSRTAAGCSPFPAPRAISERSQLPPTGAIAGRSSRLRSWSTAS